MPRKTASRPGPKSKQKQRSKSSENIRLFLGDESATEESAAGESFLSADLDGQTDYGFDFTNSRTESRRKSSKHATITERPSRTNSDRPSTSAASKNRTEKTKPVRKKRKQLNPKQRNKKFWKEVQKLQLRTDNLIPRANLVRVIREILRKVSTSANRLTMASLHALQEACEMYLTSLFQDAYLCTLHRGRVTLDVKDLALTRFLRGRSDPGNR